METKEGYSNIMNEPNQSPGLPTTSYIRVSQVEPLLPALNTLRPSTRQLGTVPTSQSLLKLFKLANPTPASLV